MQNNSGTNQDLPAENQTAQDEQQFTGMEGDDLQNITPEEFKALREQAAKANENWDKFVRATADLDNYKKRAARERLDATKYANEAFLERLLPVIDNFEAALSAINNAQGANVESVKTGVQMIFGQLKSTLNDMGLEEIDALDKKFDPNLHEAVSQQATTDVPEGQVIQQLRKGYKLRERLLRPAMVVVSSKA
ncbi:MAG: nucleotide exchange factor GrpE [Verrucomicrobiales bacterium]